VNHRVLHQPVLLDETLGLLGLGPGALVVDGTVGFGGHAEAILARTGPDGLLVGLDRDEAALDAARQRLAPFGDRVELVHASFRDLDRVLDGLGRHAADAVLLDLGVSSPQLDRPERGFAFGAADPAATPLDMRMDPSHGDTAADLLAHASEVEIARWLGEYGELPGSKRLARAIVAARSERPLRTAADLLRVIDDSGVGRGRRHHPATLVFQAVRMAVNDELGALREGLDAAVSRLRPGGRLVVLAYHSLEDRVVKRFLREQEKGCVCPPRQPVCTCGRRPRLRALNRRPLRPSDEEIADNRRARSARLRAAERLSHQEATA
jgi:16S rRNA (cytosine1402-N4)-methyltransferase